MSSYLLYVMYASREYPSLDCKWKSDLLSIHVYCKMLWENKYKEDYELIWNGLFSTIYQVLFGEEAPCLSLQGQKIFKEYGDWYMTPDGAYIIIFCCNKAPHWLPHVPDTLLLQEIAYQTYVNGVVASLDRNKKGLWSLFPLLAKVSKLRISNKPRMRLIFWPSSNSKRFLSKTWSPGKYERTSIVGWFYLELFSWRSTASRTKSTTGACEIKSPNYGPEDPNW